MATLILSAVGTVLGGPLGGALGALIGRQVDATIVGGRKIEGPRLKELSVQTSSYGSALPLHFGRIRAAGTVIWATELQERQEKSGGGKGKPSVTNFSYSASFAVAVASRPIAGIGRIWADGNLLRGEAGDLKVGGQLRIYTGHGDQPVDSLLAQAEGGARNPAYRGLAYVVLEDVELADFGNRIPSLTLEIIADDGAVSFADVIGAMTPDAKAGDLAQTPVSGFSIDQGSVGDILATLSDVTPMTCAVHDDALSFGLAEFAPSAGLPVLPAPTAGGDSAEDARADGWSRRREALPSARQCAVRYYDIARDYQPGMQRSIGRSGPGDVSIIELPAALTAAEARVLADKAAQRFTQARDTLRYRISEIDAAIGPGAMVRTSVAEGVWRIDQWEWQADGVMLDLTAVPASSPISRVTDSGRANYPTDMVSSPTAFAAFEVPWDGVGDGTSLAVRIAATSSTGGWTGAALFARRPDGTMEALGSTGKRRAKAGSAVSVLADTSPLLFDAASFVDVELASADFILDNITWAQLMQGANKAVLGQEIIQFSKAESLGSRIWRLSGLLRGRGGTEHATADHAPGEAFALLDDNLVAVESTIIGDTVNNDIVAIGRGDANPVVGSIGSAGLTLRPLAPVHGRALLRPDGGVSLTWVRRGRGAWAWLDEVDTPLNEAAERWEIGFGSAQSPITLWQTDAPALDIGVAMLSGLRASPTEHVFVIRQIGRQSRSLPLFVDLPA